MALLYRFARLNDRANTGVFTFIVTRSVTRDIHRDPTTKDFVYGYHRWAVSFTRTEKILGVFLILRNPSAGTKCYVDFSLTLLSREHFSKNEVFAERQCRFTTEHPAHGTGKWLPIGDLKGRRFTDENMEFLLELSIGNVMTVYETEVKVPHAVLSPHTKTPKIETPFFVFGNFEWNVAVHPRGCQEDGDASIRPRVLLNRLTGFDHPCRVRYRIVLGDTEKKVDSGVLDQISDLNGRIRGFWLRCQLQDLIKRNTLKVYVEMICANTISEAKVPTVREPNAAPNCYDREKQAWCAESDMDGECLKLKLFYTDLHHVPRNHLRYVSWNAYVIRNHPTTGHRESVLVLNAPHNGYYVQDGMDMGVTMETDIPVRQIKEVPNTYLESNEDQLIVHVEWLESLLLFSAMYHKYDDICRVHGHQMKREIAALQTENYSLERQLLSYQKSISVTNSKSGHASEDLADDYYFDRSLSEGQSLSETEYA